MDILVISTRTALWQELKPQFEKHGASVRLSASLEDAVNSLRTDRAALVVLDLDMDQTALRHAVFRILSIDAMMHTAAVSDLPDEEFHDAMEGLGMLANLPRRPSASDIDGLMEALVRVSA